MFLLLLILSVSCIFILLNQNNPTAVWLGLTEMHNEKKWFLKIINNGVICFCKLTLHIHIKYNICLSDPVCEIQAKVLKSNINKHQSLIFNHSFDNDDMAFLLQY